MLKVGRQNIDINKRANSALTFMVKSMKSGFKQAIGYFFNNSSSNSSRIQTLVKQAVKLVSDTGLIPKLIVCDQSSVNRSLFKSLYISPEKPWFEYKKSKIFCAFDACHLIKSSRNNLLRHNAIFDGRICKFDHIAELYNEDIKIIPRSVPKLTYIHIDLAPFAEMRVNLAAQTLSESVSAGIKTFVETGRLPKECLNTANYCERFDKMFDCANSSTFNETKVYFFNMISYLL